MTDVVLQLAKLDHVAAESKRKKHGNRSCQYLHEARVEILSVSLTVERIFTIKQSRRLHKWSLIEVGRDK